MSFPGRSGRLRISQQRKARGKHGLADYDYLGSIFAAAAESQDGIYSAPLLSVSAAVTGGWLYLHCLLSGVLIVFWSDGQGVYVLFLTLLFLCLVMLFHIDNSVFYLPDKLVFPVLWAGLLFQNEVRLVTISSALYGVIGGFFCSGVWRKAMPGAGKKRPGRRGYQTVFCLRCLGGGGTARAVADAGLCVRAGGVGLQYLRHRCHHHPRCGPRIIAFGPHLIAGMIMVMGMISGSRFQ